MRYLLLLIAVAFCLTAQAKAQELKVTTITREPFSMAENGRDTGFSLDLWDAVMKDMGRDYQIVRAQNFTEMLYMVETGSVDAAVANISITAKREEVMDFTQPIYEAGLQIMVPHAPKAGGTIWRAIFSLDLLLAVLLAFALLVGVGMLMWRFEHGKQSYFDKPAGQALFPAFWWALNLVVNGGFEERVPRSPFGRLLGVLLVLSSLFIVSVFVAKITAAITIDAIQGSVNSISDLEGRNIGTMEGSTAAQFLDRRDMRFTGFNDLGNMLGSFENGELDAVVFDAPILAYYANTAGRGTADLVGPVFLRENYGIALPTGSPLAEPINQSLLRLRENGTYQTIERKWFGNSAN